MRSSDFAHSFEEGTKLKILPNQAIFNFYEVAQHFFLLKWRQLNNTSFTLWSNPAWITVTFKWFVTRPMLTSRIGNTNWTIGTVPSNLTSAMIRSSAFSIDASFNELMTSNNESLIYKFWFSFPVIYCFDLLKKKCCFPIKVGRQNANTTVYFLSAMSLVAYTLIC